MSVESYEDLTAAQKEVVNSTAPTLLVLGGAGVGKTTTALWAGRCEAERARAEERGDQPARVLFVTFSRTAVSQIQDRAGGVLARMGDAVEIMTFHGLAYRLLRAFGRYVGTSVVPEIVGEARQKVLGRPRDEFLTYDDLLPGALRLLEGDTPTARLLRSRWRMVICDEFQDTDDLEWRLLEVLGESCRLLLLADPNQMIYQFKSGVSEARLDVARTREGFSELTLPPGSHRDPTQVLPDAAAEVRWRRFDTEPVGRAVGLGRLIVRGSVPEDDRGRAGAILEEVRSLRAVGHRTIGIYAKTNNDAAGLSVELADLGLWHIPIGFSEVYGEALAAMDAMAEYAAGGGEWPDVLTALAVTMAASVRSPSPPALSVALHRGEGYPRLLQQRLDELRRLLSEAPDVGDLAEVAASAWTQLGFTAGRRSWERAGRTFTAVARRAAMDRLDSRVRLSRSTSALRSALMAEFPGREFKVIPGDCNETVVGALRDLKHHDRAATFAFIDPDGPDFRWSTIERLAAFKRTGLPKTELFVLVPAPMFIRLLPKDGSVTAKNAKRLTRMFGTDAWERIYHARVANDLEPAEAREEYVNLVRWRLEQDLRYEWTHPLEVRNTRNVPIYYLVFASDHEVGNKIMTAVYGKASREFGKLRQEAGQLRLAQEEEARGVLKLLSDDELSDLTSAPEPRGERYTYEPPWVPFAMGEGGR